MNFISLIIFISLITIIHSTYNPIPVGSVIISTKTTIFVMQPKEYGGTDQLDIIFTVTTGMTIVNTIYDPSARNLYIMFTNASTNNTLYLCQLASLEQLDSTVYQLPITFNTTNINKLNSFTSDIINRRAFLTDQTGAITLFSMSGLMETIISSPTIITTLIRSVAYANVLNQLFVITDSTVSSCTNLDINHLHCCEGLPQGKSFRSIAFDQVSGDLYVYILDETTGIYLVVLNRTGCPTALRPINQLGTYTNLQFVIDRGLYFASGSSQNAPDNSLLIIANTTQNPRSISIGISIVALHISYPSTQSTTVESCYHTISYNTCRIAIILAAIFGTIMGIFMCFNALFCIDFFMTKRILRNLKRQIPHNLLEDRWNKLVEEKYAKLALEKQRKKDDPPPPPRRKSSTSGRKTSSSTAGNYDNNQASEGAMHTTDSVQVPKPISNISAYIRRKSEDYLSRRRSDDYRSHQHQQSTDSRGNSQQYQLTTVQVHIKPVEEERETRKELPRNLSRKELLGDDEAFL